MRHTGFGAERNGFSFTGPFAVQNTIAIMVSRVKLCRNVGAFLSILNISYRLLDHKQALFFLDTGQRFHGSSSRCQIASYLLFRY